MAFVRSKTVNGRAYYYLVENERENGKVKQSTIAYMSTCPTIEEAYQHWCKIAGMTNRKAIELGHSEIDRLRARQNMWALSEYRDKTTVQKEDKERGVRRKRAAETRSRKRRAEETRRKAAQEPRTVAEFLTAITLDSKRGRALATLGLSDGQCDLNTIKSTYRTLAKVHHPDKGVMLNGSAALMMLTGHSQT